MTTNFNITHTATGAHIFTAHIFPSNFAIHMGRGLRSFPASAETALVEKACRWLAQDGTIACGVNLDNDWTVSKAPDGEPTLDGMLIDARHLAPRPTGTTHRKGLVSLAGTMPWSSI